MESIPNIKAPTIKTPKTISIKPGTNVGINYKVKSTKSAVPGINIDSKKIFKKDKMDY